jgi:hypothetical protein
MKSVLASYTLSLAVFIPISGWIAPERGLYDDAGTRTLAENALPLARRHSSQ